MDHDKLVSGRLNVVGPEQKGGGGAHLDGAVLATGLQAQDAERRGDDNLLLAVVRGRDTLEDLEALKGSGTTGGLSGTTSLESACLRGSDGSAIGHRGRKSRRLTLWGTIPRTAL